MRTLIVLMFLMVPAIPAMARDDGGFGAGFTQTPPSALMEAPDSQIAQSVQTPSADELQNIMPAAGEETAPPTDEQTASQPVRLVQPEEPAHK